MTNVVEGLMAVYREQKARHPGMLLLFRMGDFYEAFGDDAGVAARVLGLTLTSRDKRLPMAGFPHHQLENYLRKLLADGHRVAVCDEAGDPAEQYKPAARERSTRVEEPTMSTAVARYTKMIDSLDAKIARLQAGGADNTPKRAAQQARKRHDAEVLVRVREACRQFVAAARSGELPGAYAKFAAVYLEKAFRTRIDYSSGGYYSHGSDTGQYTDAEYRSAQLREWVAARRGEAGRAADAGRAEAARVKQAEESLRFRDIPGFFPTPGAVIFEMVQRAARPGVLLEGKTVLEPSAGKGDIADVIRAAGGAVECVEVNPTLADFLVMKGFAVQTGDFLAMPPPKPGMLKEAGKPERWHDERFDLVLMNPPFENCGDVCHVEHAYQFLKPGGRLVAVMSAGWMNGSKRRYVKFREWFGEMESDGNAERVDLPEGAFKGAFRSTGVRCVLVVLDKPDPVAEKAAWERVERDHVRPPEPGQEGPPMEYVPATAEPEGEEYAVEELVPLPAKCKKCRRAFVGAEAIRAPSLAACRCAYCGGRLAPHPDHPGVVDAETRRQAGAANRPAPDGCLF